MREWKLLGENLSELLASVILSVHQMNIEIDEINHDTSTEDSPFKEIEIRSPALLHSQV